MVLCAMQVAQVADGCEPDHPCQRGTSVAPAWRQHTASQVATPGPGFKLLLQTGATLASQPTCGSHNLACTDIVSKVLQPAVLASPRDHSGHKQPCSRVAAPQPPPGPALDAAVAWPRAAGPQRSRTLPQSAPAPKNPRPVRTRNCDAVSTCYCRAGNTSRAQACARRRPNCRWVGCAPGSCRVGGPGGGGAGSNELRLFVCNVWAERSGESDLRRHGCPAPQWQPCRGALAPSPSSQAEEAARGRDVSPRFSAGYALLAAAVSAPPNEVDPAERRGWLALAAAASRGAGEGEAAAQILAELVMGGAPGPAAAMAGASSGRAK